MVLPEDSFYVPLDNSEVSSSRQIYILLEIQKKVTVLDGPWSTNFVLDPRLM